MARLQVSFQGAEFGFDLRGDAVKIGAAATNQLVLKDASVSKEHVELRRMGPTWRLVDLESAAGTRVNGLFVNKQDLKDGDVVAVGAARLTFQAEDGAAASPAPIPSAAVPAPIVNSPVPTPIPASPVYAAPVAYAPPPPVYRAPPPPARERERERDRDDSRDRKRGRRGGGGGGAKAGGAVGMMFIGLIAVGFVVLLIVLNKQTTKRDTNLAILQQITAARAQGRHDLVVALEGQGDPAFSNSMREIQIAIADSKKVLGERSVLASAEESVAYYNDQIKAPRNNRSLDAPSLTLRCDEFLKRWPTHEKANDVLFIRMCMNGEPPSFWAQLRGGAAPGQGGYVSPGTLLGAAETEAAIWLADENYSACFRVYQLFLDKSLTTVAAAAREQFRTDMSRKQEFIRRKAVEGFEKIEEKAMVLEDRRSYEQAQALYKEAREKYGVPEILIRCDAELERLKEKLR